LTVVLNSIGNDEVGWRSVGSVGLGALRLCQPLVRTPDEVASVLRAAMDAGITLVDTADVYGPIDAGVAAYGFNEWQLADAIHALGVAHELLLVTKVGIVRTPSGFTVDSTRGYLMASVDASLRRLGVDDIDLYIHHRPDPNIPYGEAMQTMRDIFDSGKARMIGISNVSTDQIAIAQQVLGPALVCVQNRYSPLDRATRPALDLCTARGLAYLTWAPLGGAGGTDQLASIAPLSDIAEQRGVSVQRVALAWALHESDFVIPIPGASRPESIVDAAAACALTFTAADHALINSALAS
jgi:aryl-alcohol dehydrogenase-like predicted oxidoreductase